MRSHENVRLENVFRTAAAPLALRSCNRENAIFQAQTRASRALTAGAPRGPALTLTQGPEPNSAKTLFQSSRSHGPARKIELHHPFRFHKR